MQTAVPRHPGCREYLETDWRCPSELYGIGKYAADAYAIFCQGRWRETKPEDKDLARYRDWLEATGGLGTGLVGTRAVPGHGHVQATVRESSQGS